MTMIVLRLLSRLLPLFGLKSRWHRHFNPRPPNKVFFRGGGVSLDSWTPGPKPLCHRHPTGPHPSGLLWTRVDSRHADSTMSDFALAALFQPGHERLEPRRPLGGVQAGGRMAELAVDLEVVGGDAGLLELGHHARCDRRREELV